MNHRCILLAVDPAKVSGYAIFGPSGPIESGAVKAISELAKVVEIAQTEAELAELPLVVIGEEWAGRRKTIGIKQISGMGAAWGRWLAVLEQAKHPKRRTLRLDTGTWRKRAYGTSRRKSAQWKAMAKSYVYRRFHRELESDDEAEAMVLGHVAMRSPEVAEVLPKLREPQARRGDEE